MPEKEPLAIFTIVQDEPVFLPIWLEHYTKAVGQEHLYILDHDTPAGNSWDPHAWDAEARIVPIHNRASFDHRWLANTVSKFQQFLLQSYDAVLFAEVDEIVISLRLGASLADLAKTLTSAQPFIRCEGHEVVHRSGEGDLNFSAPLLKQRKWWYPSQLYSKTLLSSVAMHWDVGFHIARNVPVTQETGPLALLHLHKIDFQTALARHRSAAGRNWNAADLESGMGVQNRITSETALIDWFEANIDNTNEPAPFVEMPDQIREVI